MVLENEDALPEVPVTEVLPIEDIKIEPSPDEIVEQIPDEDEDSSTELDSNDDVVTPVTDEITSEDS